MTPPNLDLSINVAYKSISFGWAKLKLENLIHFFAYRQKDGQEWTLILLLPSVWGMKIYCNCGYKFCVSSKKYKGKGNPFKPEVYNIISYNLVISNSILIEKCLADISLIYINELREISFSLSRRISSIAPACTSWSVLSSLNSPT